MSDGSQSVKDILLSLGYSPKDMGKNYGCRPLYRDSDNSCVLSVHKETGLWYDFKEGVGGNLNQLVQRTLGVGPSEAASKLSSFSPVQEDESQGIEQVRIWPVSCLTKLKPDHRYWIGRKIPESVVSLFRGGVAEEGRMYYRYVFPIFTQDGKIIGFAGRDLLKSATEQRPKWKIIGPKKEFCYPSFLNSDFLIESNIFLVESIGDMLSLWSNGIKNVLVVFGLNIHHEVIKTLIRSRPKMIYIALNKDVKFAGQKAAAKMRDDLLEFFDSERIEIVMPEENDYNEMTSQQFDLWKTKLKNYQPPESRP
jgi:hypothetical protein